VAGKLAERLKRIRDAEAGGAKRARRDERPRGDGAPLPGWRRIAPAVLERTTVVEAGFPAEIDLAPFLVPRLLPLSAGAPAETVHAARERLAFIDTETTGLSTGAGTYVFAFGAGRFTGKGFAVRQLFLEDYPGEPDFLAAVAESLEGTDRLVHYNGKAFDVPLLRTRFLMNGRRFPELAQTDLLHAARRLWARPLGGASLREIEEGALAFRRKDDVPGSEAPERYLRFLAARDAEEIMPVLDHHLTDIATLPRLMARAARAFEEPDGGEGTDPLRLGIILYKLGRPGWEERLRSGAEAGDHQCLRWLAAIYRREGRWPDASALLSRFAATIQDFIALAKVAEHRMRDFDAALGACARAVALRPEKAEREAIQARMARLRKKAGYR